jgi:hypothetical protein
MSSKTLPVFAAPMACSHFTGHSGPRFLGIHVESPVLIVINGTAAIGIGVFGTCGTRELIFSVSANFPAPSLPA